MKYVKNETKNEFQGLTDSIEMYFNTDVKI